jgi:hypothetical protein
MKRQIKSRPWRLTLQSLAAPSSWISVTQVDVLDMPGFRLGIATW